MTELPSQGQDPDDAVIRPLRERTDAKLRYAEVHLKELAAREPLGGDDFDRAHQESFLYHLFGAQAAFLLELNALYGVGLPPEGVTPGALRKALAGQGRKSAELTELYALEQDEDSWYSDAKRMRDHSTHVSGVKRLFHLGGSKHQSVFLTVPGSAAPMERHFPEAFADWLSKMQELVTRLRRSAILTTQPVVTPDMRSN